MSITSPQATLFIVFWWWDDGNGARFVDFKNGLLWRWCHDSSWRQPSIWYPWNCRMPNVTTLGFTLTPSWETRWRIFPSEHEGEWKVRYKRRYGFHSPCTLHFVKWIVLTFSNVQSQLVTGLDGIIQKCCSLSTVDKSKFGEDWEVEGVSWWSTCPMTSHRRERRLFACRNKCGLSGTNSSWSPKGNRKVCLSFIWCGRSTKKQRLSQTTRCFKWWQRRTPNNVTNWNGPKWRNFQPANDQISETDNGDILGENEFMGPPHQPYCSRDAWIC